MPTYKTFNRVTAAIQTVSTADALVEQWHGRAVMDTTTTAGTAVALDQSNSPHLALSDAQALMGPTHRGKAWSGA